MMDLLIQILTGGLGTLGFAFIARVRVKHLVPATLGGMLSWAIYLAVFAPTESVFVATLISAMAVYSWSEVMARIMKAPVTIFLVPGILPLLPGSFLYYTVLALLNGEDASFRYYGYSTVIVTLGIACGVVTASIIISYFLKTMEHLSSRKTKH